jgi:predicted Ser/Thr protein kinase
MYVDVAVSTARSLNPNGIKHHQLDNTLHHTIITKVARGSQM